MMANPNDWQTVTSDNAATVEDATNQLRIELDARQYGDFWTDVKDVSRLFKDLKPLLRQYSDGRAITSQTKRRGRTKSFSRR